MLCFGPQHCDGVLHFLRRKPEGAESPGRGPRAAPWLNWGSQDFKALCPGPGSVRVVLPQAHGDCEPHKPLEGAGRALRPGWGAEAWGRAAHSDLGAS